MRVIDIFTGQDLTADQLDDRSLREAPERAAREALADAAALIYQLKSGAVDAHYAHAIDHALLGLRNACEANGIDPALVSVGSVRSGGHE